MTSLPVHVGVVTLRELIPSDVADLVLQADSRALWRNMTHLFPHPYTYEDGIEWIDRCMQDDPPTSLAITTRGAFAGVCGVSLGSGVGDRAARIGYWLGEEFWGRGLATQALAALLRYVWDTFPIERLQAEVFAWNPASARVLEKNGFQLEGTRRKAIHKDGELIDEWVYSLLRSDMEPR